jgi:tRNA threonylcarbamoyladenosine biosynthesis protein TsaB
MAYILSLETSTKVSSVALHSGGALVGAQQLHIDKSHSGLLTVMIDDLLKCCSINLNELAAVAVSNGPGSYTGLRIGLSTAKGLCFGLGIPLLTLSTLDVLEQAVLPFIPKSDKLCPMLDARRMEVYTQLSSAKGERITQMQPTIVENSSFSTELANGRVWFFGSGSTKCRSVLNHPNAKFVEGVEPLASTMGGLAFRKFKNKEYADLAYSEPIYLKEFGGRPLTK